MRCSIALSDVSAENACNQRLQLPPPPKWGASVAVQLSMLTALKHQTELFDITSGMFSLIYPAPYEHRVVASGDPNPPSVGAFRARIEREGNSAVVQ
jgi:hypothetical protein